MEDNLDILYRIEDLLQETISYKKFDYIEECLHLLNGVINNMELASIEHIIDDDENDIPFDC